MSGNKLAQAKEAAIMAVERLGRDDYVSIVTYSSEVDVLMPSTRVTSPTEFRHRIRNIRSNRDKPLSMRVQKEAFANWKLTWMKTVLTG